VEAQRHALAVTTVALGAKLAAAYFMAPRFGYLGVAAGAVAVEILFALVPVLYLLHAHGGFRLAWKVPFRAAAFALAAGWAAHAFDGSGGLVAALLAPAFYAILVLGTRTMPHGPLLSLIPGSGR
jgi:O-antigen/teichoic acid export membrane protein